MVKEVFYVHQLVNPKVYVGISIKIVEVCNKVFIFVWRLFVFIF